MPTVASQVKQLQGHDSPPVSPTDDGGEDGEREHREGVQPENRAHDGQHDGSYGQHGYPLSTAQALANSVALLPEAVDELPQRPGAEERVVVEAGDVVADHGLLGSGSGQ